MKVIELQNIGKRYKISRSKRMLARALLFGWLGKNREEDFWALQDIDLDVNKGEIVGIIGDNGFGKTTLLKILSGITSPSCGSIKINGKVSSLLELGTGFHPDLTGRENIYLNGSLLGLKKKEIDAKFQEIVDFSGLKDFIDAPLKTYSSGMYLRLGFSVAMNVSADILLIDEVLSVGDETFQKECVKKIKEFRDVGKTIVFVSHDMDMVLSLCDRVFLLKNGKISKTGSPVDVVQFYLDMTGKKGVTALQKGSLDIIFNQGKLSLYWQGKKITKGWGGFSSINIDKKWQHSIQADWVIKSRSQDEIIVLGKWPRVPVTQTWKINITKQNSLELSVITECMDDIKIEQEQINLMLTASYSRFFADGAGHDFPNIQSNQSDWEYLLQQDLILNSLAINHVDSQEIQLPSIYFKPIKENSEDIIRIYNSDNQNEARILQCLSTTKERTKSYTGIEVAFDLPGLSDSLVKRFEERIEEIIFCENDLKVYLDSSPKVFWKNIELPVHHSSVKKYIDNGLLEIKLQEEEVNLQREEIRRKEEEIKLQKEQLLRKKEEINLQEDQMRRHNEEIKLQEEEMRRHQEEVKLKEEEIRLQKEEIMRKKEAIKRQEEEIRLQKEEEVRRQEEQQFKDLYHRTLEKDKARVIFKDGMVRLYWKDIEITKGLGIYTAICYDSRWYHSTESEWEIEKLSDAFILKGISLYLPVEQIWELKFSSEYNTILWDIDIVVKQKLAFEHGCAGIMLSDIYKKWFTSQRMGIFQDSFGKSWIDIVRMDFVSEFGKAKSCDEKNIKSIIPEVIFKLNDKSENNFVRISNTDSYYKSRVIQLLRSEPEDKVIFSPGRYRYFSTSICLIS